MANLRNKTLIINKINALPPKRLRRLIQKLIIFILPQHKKRLYNIQQSMVINLKNH